GEHARLAAEAGDGDRVEVVRDLERDRVAGGRVAGAEDRAHAALRHLAQDLEAPGDRRHASIILEDCRLPRPALRSSGMNVITICSAGGAATPMVELAGARAEPGRGLEGDRYFDKAGTYSRTEGSGREVTLIELEALEAAARDYGLDIPPRLTRRNLLTRGV